MNLQQRDYRPSEQNSCPQCGPGGQSLVGVPICNGHFLKKSAHTLGWLNGIFFLCVRTTRHHGQGSSSECRFSTWVKKNFRLIVRLSFIVCAVYVDLFYWCAHIRQTSFFRQTSFWTWRATASKTFSPWILTTLEDRMSFVFVSKSPPIWSFFFSVHVYIWCYISHHS